MAMNISKSSLRSIYCSLNWMFFLIWNSWQMRRLARKLSLAFLILGRMMKGSFWMCSCCQRSRFSLSSSDRARFRSQCALHCGSLRGTGSRWCDWQTHSASKAMHLAFIDSHFHCFSLQATKNWLSNDTVSSHYRNRLTLSHPLGYFTSTRHVFPCGNVG